MIETISYPEIDKIKLYRQLPVLPRLMVEVETKKNSWIKYTGLVIFIE